MDPDQDRQNRIQTVWYFDSVPEQIFQKKFIKKQVNRWQKEHENYPASKK